MTESPDTIHGRMKEGAHLAAYSVARVIENLKYLLTDGKFRELSAGYANVNEFLRDTQTPFEKLKISAEERKEITQLVKDLQPDASQRAIADMVGVSDETVARDLGNRDATNVAISDDEQEQTTPEDATNVAPQPWTADDDFEPDKAGASKKFYQSSEDIVWSTPQWLFDLLNDEFNFEVDVCATEENAKCEIFYTENDNGLDKNWEGTCWMNPPYGNDIRHWMEKARKESDNGATVVCLVPGAYETEWFRESAKIGEVRLINNGRVKWRDMGAAPFPSAVIILRPNKQNKLLWWEVNK